MIVPERAVDGRSLVAFADVLVSAGGTMNREAAVLGTPVWSMFEGPLGAVDEQLAREGRLRFLTDPAEVNVEKRAARAYEQRVRRDPRELLRLALPWLKSRDRRLSHGALHRSSPVFSALTHAVGGRRRLVAHEAPQPDRAQVAALEDLERVDHPDRRGEHDQPAPRRRSASGRRPSRRPAAAARSAAGSRRPASSSAHTCR